MAEIESLLTSLSTVDALWIYVVLFGIAYLENIFPPSPSDLLIVFGGSLVGMGKLSFLGALLSATAGSTLGFITMYIIGGWFGLAIIEKKRIGFLPLDAIHNVGCEIAIGPWNIAPFPEIQGSVGLLPAVLDAEGWAHRIGHALGESIVLITLNKDSSS